jgi:hypothetical protein
MPAKKMTLADEHNAFQQAWSEAQPQPGDVTVAERAALAAGPDGAAAAREAQAAQPADPKNDNQPAAAAKK